ncbi:hypothetical protein BYT27DRAFT_7219253 [Phlegmacium glaucopus]|nr:hypothetical protein BYT27DRAFT_7219253 [Phlegmacium glaucopus]
MSQVEEVMVMVGDMAMVSTIRKKEYPVRGVVVSDMAMVTEVYSSIGVVSGSPYSVPVLSLVSGSTLPSSNSETSPYLSGSSDITPNPLPHLQHNNFFVITFPLSVSTPAMDYSPRNAGLSGDMV